MFNNMKNPQGSVLILSLLITTILLLLGAVFLDLTIINIKNIQVGSVEVEQAFWIAKAGVAKTIHDLKENYFQNEQRLVEKKFGSGAYRVGVITLKEQGIHELLIISIGVILGDEEFEKYKNNLLPETITKYSIVTLARISSTTDYLYFMNGRNIIGALPDGGEPQGFILYGPIHSNSKIFITGNGKFTNSYDVTYQCGLDIVKPRDILGPAISTADILFREAPGYDPSKTYYWKRRSGQPGYSNLVGEGDINIGIGNISFTSYSDWSINWDAKYNLMDYNEFALSFKNGLPLSIYHDESDISEPLDPDYTGGKTQDNTFNNLVRDKNHGGFYIQVPKSNEIFKYYQSLIDENWHITKNNTKNFPIRKFQNDIIAKRDLLGIYNSSTTTDFTYHKLDNIKIGVGDGVNRDFLCYKPSMGVTGLSSDFRKCDIKQIKIGGVSIPINSNGWSWGTVQVVNYRGQIAFSQLPQDTDIISIGFSGVWKLGYGGGDANSITDWYIYPHGIPIRHIYINKSANTAGHPQTDPNQIIEAATAGYTCTFYDNVGNIIQRAGGGNVQIGDIETKDAYRIRIIDGSGNPVPVMSADGFRMEVSLDFDDNKVPEYIGDNQRRTKVKNSGVTTINVGIGGNGVIRLFNNGPNQPGIPGTIPPDSWMTSNFGADNGNGFYIFYPPYGSMPTEVTQKRIDAGFIQTRSGCEIQDVYVNGIACPFLNIRDGRLDVAPGIRIHNTPQSGDIVEIEQPIFRVYNGLESDGKTGFDYLYWDPGINREKGMIAGTYWDIIGDSTIRLKPGWGNGGKYIGVDHYVEAVEIDLSSIKDFSVNPKYPEGWYDYNENGKKDDGEEAYGIIFSDVPLIIKGNPSQPVTIVCMDDVYIRNINSSFSDDDPNAKPVGIISAGGIWTGMWRNDIPGDADGMDVVCNKVALYSQGSSLYRFGGIFGHPYVSLGRFKLIGSVFLGGEYFGDYYMESKGENENNKYSYGIYTKSPTYPSSYGQPSNYKIPYIYASSFRGDIVKKDPRKIPPHHMPVDFKIITTKPTDIKESLNFIENLRLFENKNEMVDKNTYLNILIKI